MLNWEYLIDESTLYGVISDGVSLFIAQRDPFKISL